MGGAGVRRGSPASNYDDGSLLETPETREAAFSALQPRGLPDERAVRWILGSPPGAPLVSGRRAVTAADTYFRLCRNNELRPCCFEVAGNRGFFVSEDEVRRGRAQKCRTKGGSDPLRPRPRCAFGFRALISIKPAEAN